MNEKQETVMDVCYFADKEISTLGTNGWKNVIDRIFAAHNREMAEKDARIALLEKALKPVMECDLVLLDDVSNAVRDAQSIMQVEVAK